MGGFRPHFSHFQTKEIVALFSAFLALKLCMISSLSRGHLTNFNLMLLLFRTQAFTLEDLLEAGKNKYVGVVGSNRASGSFFQRTPFGNTFRKELKRMQSRTSRPNH